MNLKYYLRGLGLGILVTALILTIAGNKKSSMTDAQIKERAKELGMIENTVLVEREQEEEVAETEAETTVEQTEPEKEKEAESIQPIEENEQPVDESETQDSKDAVISDDPEAPTVVKQDNEEEVSEDDIQAVDDESQAEEPAKEEKQTDKTGEGDTSSESQEAEPQETSSTANGDAETAPHTQGTLTIVSGDSSYSVAKKLYEMGIVASVEQTDRFLCANGYDRTIRTGTYTIGAEDTLEDIAKKINGK